jgi:hypothetical protein
MDRTERQIITLLLLAVAALSLAYALITPAWANVEEPGHFEYVRYLVRHRRLPDENGDPAIRQRILDTFIWKHHRLGAAGRMDNALLADAFGLRTGADWIALRDELSTRPGYEDLSGGGDITIATPQLAEAPGYYLIAALTQLPIPNASVEVQLLFARLASVAIGLLAVWLAYLTAAELFPRRRVMRVAVPALVGLQPSFIVLASAVNNTIAAVMAVALIMYASVRLVRRGYGWAEFALLIAGALACLLSKPTAYLGLLVGLLALPLAVRRRYPVWIPAGLVVLAIAGLAITLYWKRPASWYPVTTQAAYEPDAPAGPYVFNLSPGEDERKELWQALNPNAARSLSGRTVTLGAWLRAPYGQVLVDPPELWAAPNEGVLAPLDADPGPLTVGPEWRFYARTFDVPPNTQCMSVRLIPWATETSVSDVQVDGLALVTGGHPVDDPPAVLSESGGRLRWGGQPVDNVLYNGAAERGYPQIRPWVLDLLPSMAADTELDPELRLASFLDWRANWPALSTSLRWLFTSFWSRFAWANPGLPGGAIRALALASGLSGLGLVYYALRGFPHAPLWQRRALGLSAVAAAVIVGLAVLRLDPIVLPLHCDFYQARFISTGYYIIPGLLPLLLLWAFGLLGWLPPRWDRWVLAALVFIFFWLVVGSLFGQQIPDYLTIYGVDPPRSLWTWLWGWTF